MAVGCGAKFAKFVLFAFNVIFWLCGLALLIIGIVFLIDPNVALFQNILNDAEPMLRASAIALIILGGVTFIIGFAGCCGAIKESRCLLVMYIILLFILMAVEIAIAVYAAVKMKSVEKLVAKEFLKAMKQYPPPSNSYDAEQTRYKDAIDQLQFTAFKCCGVNSSAEWTSVPFFTSQSAFVKQRLPASCCPDFNGKLGTAANLTVTSCAYTGIGSFQQGCSDGIMNWIQKNYPIIVAVFACVATVEGIGMFLALCLCLSIRRRELEGRPKI